MPRPRRRTWLDRAAVGALALAAAASIVVVPSRAVAAPATPRFGPAIEGYAPSQYQSTCDPAAKPGVVDFRDLLNRTYGTHNSGIGRACDVGGTSEHKEGRALDYSFNAFDPGQAAQANDVINWLLATDQYGNVNAMARRLGIMYLIWNRRIWQRGVWSNYSGPSPHTDHIHFSFGWPGALRQTSWWHPEGPAAPDRIVVIDGAGNAQGKEGNLWASWVFLGYAARQVVADGDRIGLLSQDGTLYVKEGGMSAGWVAVFGGAKSFAMSGDRIGVVDTANRAWVKEGPLNAGWVWESDNAASIALSDRRIGVVDTGGTAWVKDGNLYESWTNQMPGVKQVELSGTRIGVVSTGGAAYVKEGNLHASWVPQASAVVDIALAGNRIGIVGTNGVASVKEGTLYDAWVTQLPHARDVELDGNRIGVHDTSQNLHVKEGNLWESWVTQLAVRGFSLS